VVRLEIVGAGRFAAQMCIKTSRP